MLVRKVLKKFWSFSEAFIQSQNVPEGYLSILIPPQVVVGGMTMSDRLRGLKSGGVDETLYMLIPTS